ncbi:hypothetical protein L7F22_029101 [Adiantum nelumboides]|nr:hypothetical protein [Adiantum nelumboides]
MEPLNYASSRAAAWAWYQRGAGSGATLTSARSEPIGSAASGPQRSALTRGGSSPSRFKLEADLLILSSASEDASDRLKSLHLLPHLSDSSYGGSDAICQRSSMLASPRMSETASPDAADLSIVMSGSIYGTTSWDCGSSLFDSFELVAMSKKLDLAHQLDESAIEKVCPPAEDVPRSRCAELGSDEDEEVEDGNEATSTGLHALRPTPTGMGNICEIDADTDSNSALNDCKQSRQAIYDMFCRLENLDTPVGPVREYEHVKKSSTNSPLAPRSGKQYRRRRFHSLSKAFRHHFVQLTRQSGRRSPIPMDGHRTSDKVHIQQSASLPARIFPNVQTHDHKTVIGLESRGRKDWIKADLSCSFEASKHSFRNQYSSNDAYHHHHQHYHHYHHYLFRHHSDDCIGLLPVAPLLDKSHQVAAAGLRASKVSSLHSPASEGAFPDSNRMWGDANNHVTASFPVHCYAYPIPQER